MKESPKKGSVRKKLLLGAVSIVFATMIFTSCGKKDNPDKVVQQYCDILVDGNYGDILDIAYFPESEYITKDKIEELKKEYFNKMVKSNNGITKCTFTKANETDDIDTYKLSMETTNGNDTANIEVRKDVNKIVLDGLYHEKSLTAFKGSTIFIDDKEVSVKPKEKSYNEGNQVETYTFTVLNDVNYDVKITHPIFKDETTTLEDGTDYTENTRHNFKDDFIKELDSSISDMLTEIVTSVFEEKDTESLNKYFSNNNAKKFISDYGEFKTIVTDTSGTFNYTFKSVDGMTTDTIQYTDDSKLFMRVFISCTRIVTDKNNNTISLFTDNGLELVDSYEDTTGKQLEFTCIKQDGVWKISDWDSDSQE